MQIVIDIPQKWFDDMVREEFTDIDELCAVIQHGTPLPKGHGRLIDADDLTQEDKVMDIWIGGYELMVRVKTINNSPTIIEADKGE